MTRLTDSERRIRARPITLAALFFIASAVAMTWPLSADLAHQVPDPGVPYLIAWILHWDWVAAHRPLAHFFDANIFFPNRLSLAFSENLIGAAIFGVPLFAANAPPVLVYNILLLTGISLMGFAAWLLAYEITRDPSSSLLCGIIFAFVPYRSATLQFFQLQWAGFLPLIFLFLIRSWESGKPRDLILFSLFFTWNALTGIYFGIFASIGVFLTIAAWTVGSNWRSTLRSTLKIGRSLGVSAVALLPIFLVYFHASKLYGFRRPLDLVTARSASWSSFLTGGSAGWLFGAAIRQDSNPEWQLFPGAIAVLLLALLALRRASVAGSPDIALTSIRRRWIFVMLIVGVLTALGGHTSFYRILYRIFPVLFGGIRDPARAFNLALLAIGVLCSLSLASALRFARPRLRAVIVLVFCAATLAEYTAVPVHFYSANTSPSPLTTWLGNRPSTEALLQLPLKTSDNLEYVFQSTQHLHPIVNGYSGFYPPGFVELTRSLKNAADYSTVAAMVEATGASLLVFHIRRATPIERGLFASLARSGMSGGFLDPLAYLHGPFDDCLVFRISTGRSLHRGPTQPALADTDPRTLDAINAFISRPTAIPPLAEATTFAWPDLF